jgi:ABC-type antimicrobial peptide transport system permease subunit
MQVVGVVADVRSEELAREPEMEIYRPQFQAPLAVATLVVRTSADPQSLISPIRNSIRQLEPNLPLDKVQSLEQVVSTSLADSRFKATLLGILAALALVLAAVGVYGLVSNAVRLRMHEIGIRVAMGARRDELIWMLIRQGMMPVVIGLIIGLGGAYAACRLLASQLYKVGSADPLTYIGALVVLTAVALFANWLPVSRATRIHPRETLRYE